MRGRILDGSMVASGLLLLFAAVRPWDGLDVMVGDDVVQGRSVTAWQISPLCWVPLVLGMALVPLWFAPRTAALWRWLPTAVSGLAVLGLVAVLVGLATGPSDDYGWYAEAPPTGNPDVRYVDGRASPILLALAGLAIQAYAGLARNRAQRRASRPSRRIRHAPTSWSRAAAQRVSACTRLWAPLRV